MQQAHYTKLQTYHLLQGIIMHRYRLYRVKTIVCEVKGINKH